ncbi:MAG: 30S ribosomal protein S16 [Leptospiraceae bacterium]|nr:30S ribosomal protein S16 [Leptospiraceae bacterium]MCP5495427.1 30S ribosomal protein S16 [Leptospiraceae bacterium]
MVRIRLQRTGAKNEPHYRVVAADSNFPRDGRFIEILGHYHPVYKTGQTVFKEEKVVEWLKKGAQPTNTVKELLKKSGIWSKFTQKKVQDES